MVVPVVHRIFISFTSASGAAALFETFIFWAKSYIALALAQRDYARTFILSQSLTLFCQLACRDRFNCKCDPMFFFFAAAAHIYNCFKLKKQKCFVLIFFFYIIYMSRSPSCTLTKWNKIYYNKRNRARQRKETYTTHQNFILACVAPIVSRSAYICMYMERRLKEVGGWLDGDGHAVLFEPTEESRIELNNEKCAK